MLTFFFFFFGDATRLAGSQFPDQGLNPGHSSESLATRLGHQGSPKK